jgi:hypothetical protein
MGNIYDIQTFIVIKKKNKLKSNYFQYFLFKIIKRSNFLYFCNPEKIK